MRKRNLWFIPALLTFLLLTVMIPISVREALNYDGINQMYNIGLAVFTLASLLINFFSMMLIRTRGLLWLLVAAYVGWSGLLFGTFIRELVEPNLYLNVTALGIESAAWLCYGGLLVTLMLATLYLVEPNGDSA